MTDTTTALLCMLAMGLGGAMRSWADRRQDTTSRYTVFDVILTAVFGALLPPMLRYWPRTAGFITSLPLIALLALLFIIGALLSLIVFQVIRARAPHLVEKAADKAEARFGG